jgi:hypothetical protein
VSALCLLIALQEHVRHFKIKGVRRWHMDDFPGHQERLVFYINNVAVELSISREHSKCAGVPHDVLRQVDGQLPDNFDSPALAQVGVDSGLRVTSVYL